MEITSLSPSSSYHYNTYSTIIPNNNNTNNNNNNTNTNNNNIINNNNATITSTWTFKEHKKFEEILATMHYYPQDLTCWINIASQLGKTPTDVKLHYDKLLNDVVLIESGCVPLPNYVDDYYYYYGDRCHVNVDQIIMSDSSPTGKQIMKKKGEQWTTDEHKLFLLGLKRCGKGDWKSISRNYVTTKSPTQVASHAQKFFLRQSQSTNQNNRKRTSIHDITDVDDDSLSDLIRRGVVPLNVLAPNPNANLQDYP